MTKKGVQSAPIWEPEEPFLILTSCVDLFWTLQQIRNMVSFIDHALHNSRIIHLCWISNIVSLSRAIEGTGSNDYIPPKQLP